ncbi:MAG: peptide chain release factor 1 [Rhodobiaceae bacterium]|nr:peptide chain release factor 1 [Rhodobiaceae bacterium]MCC0056927.1 peptide chain release factor 1 [Rhodobiaceae bacterium]
MSIENKIRSVIDRFEAIDRTLAQPVDPDELVRLSRERARIEPVVTVGRELSDVRAEREGLDEVLEDPATERELYDMAYEEARSLDERIEMLSHRLKVLLLPRDEADDLSAILEIRAGTGGEEAALFAADLFRMYQRYAELQGWKVEVLSASDSDLEGYREIIAQIAGSGVYAKLKFESGVHRVQRVPETESGGRIHTSAATVAVLPEAEDVDIEINEGDLKIDTYRASGAGGQHVNTTDSAVRITHIPTGVVVAVQDERSQHKNKAKAMTLLRARIYDQMRHKVDSERAAARKGLVGTGDRSERIRTYNFPQGRVSDHRINLTLYKLEKILAGEAIGEVIEALIAEDQAQRLAAVDGEA